MSVEKQGAVLAVYVQPRASFNAVTGLVGDELRLRLTSPPVDGAANKLCKTYVAKLFGVSAGRVRIIGGEKSRHKRLLLEDVSREEAASRLEVLLLPSA